jgi:hypothetical protein
MVENGSAEGNGTTLLVTTDRGTYEACEQNRQVRSCHPSFGLKQLRRVSHSYLNAKTARPTIERCHIGGNKMLTEYWMLKGR